MKRNGKWLQKLSDTIRRISPTTRELKRRRNKIGESIAFISIAMNNEINKGNDGVVKELTGCLEKVFNQLSAINSALSAEGPIGWELALSFAEGREDYVYELAEKKLKRLNKKIDKNELYKLRRERKRRGI